MKTRIFPRAHVEAGSTRQKDIRMLGRMIAGYKKTSVRNEMIERCLENDTLRHELQDMIEELDEWEEDPLAEDDSAEEDYSVDWFVQRVRFKLVSR